jgi:hypothetical protein
MKVSKRFFLAFAGIALCSSGASAQVIFTNVGAGFPADAPSFYSGNPSTFFSTTFIATTGGLLNTLSTDLLGTTSPVSVGLYTSLANEPGTLLESWTAVIPTTGAPPPVTTLRSLVHPYLSAGTQYWVVLTQSSPNQITWAQNDTAVAGGVWVDATVNTQIQIFAASPTPGITLTALVLDPGFQTHYAANLNLGESYIDITNDAANGAALAGPGFGAQLGNICVNVYAFDPSEELVSCCSCLVTPDQTVNLGVVANLTSKTLTGVVPTSVTVKLLATLAGAGGSGTGSICNNSAATATAAAVIPAGLAAWGTTLHAQGAGTATTETAFTGAMLSAGELASITGRCAAIIGNASGFGICASCRTGALGGSKL